MTPEQRENCLKWAKALRSGKYKQGQGRLRHSKKGVDYYCCLGVACDLIDNKKWGTLFQDSSKFDYYYKDDEYLILPPEELFEDYYGFSVFIRFLDDIDYKTSLARLNDKGFSFEEIAYLIEEMVAKDMGLL